MLRIFAIFSVEGVSGVVGWANGLGFLGCLGCLDDFDVFGWNFFCHPGVAEDFLSGARFEISKWGKAERSAPEL